MPGSAVLGHPLQRARSPKQRSSRRSAELFRVLVEGVREYAIFMLDPMGIVATWNAGAERTNGYRADEIVGRHYSVLFPGEDVRAGKPAAELREAASRGSCEDEGWRVRKDGSRFWGSAVITALHGPDGTLSGFAKVVRDLTDRRRSEEARRQLAVAREAVRSRDEFLTIVSHEFRTPLTTLQLELQAAVKGLVEGEPVAPAHRERLGRLQRHITRLDELVTALTNVGRLASGELRLRREPLDLAVLVRDLLDRWRPVAQRQRSELVGEVDCALPGRWDRERLSEALAAVLANAVKFGGGHPIRVRTRADERSAVIEVEDGGPGIPAEDQARVFERFERAMPVSHYGGFGVGLWIARQIAIAHGGDIEIRSAPGEGSCFTFRLPLRED